jgi:hypothetical protein
LKANSFLRWLYLQKERQFYQKRKIFLLRNKGIKKGINSIVIPVIILRNVLKATYRDTVLRISNQHRHGIFNSIV